jgi:tetratricopeptide (TPR) repeat protein
MWEIVAAEAAKVMTAGVFGGVKDVVSRKLAQRREGSDLETLLADHERLESALDELVTAEPEFGEELRELLNRRADPDRVRPVMPPAARYFVDRDAARTAAAMPGVHVISGRHGVGKSALVFQVAEELGGRFPDGQIYVDLADWRVGNTLRRTELAVHVLGQLGVERNLVASTTAEIWAQYRSMTARRKFLLALDNAESVTDVREFVPPSPTSLVLVTTIKAGQDLSLEYPSEIPLDGLDSESAVKLLSRVSDERAVTAESGAAAELVELCDRMPFAVLLAGLRIRKRLRRRPDPVSSVLAEFRTAGVLGGIDVITEAFERTFRELSADAAELCVLLASHPGPDFTEASARALLGRETAAALDELADAGFLAPARTNRNKMYHLVRESARTHKPDDTAADRLLTFYRDQAVAADYSAGMDRLRRYEPVPGVRADFEGRPPMDWVEDEREAYGALAREAYLRGKDVELGQICGALEPLMINRGHHRLFIEINNWGLKSARRLGDAALETRIASQQARAYFLLHEFPRALPLLRRSRELLEGLDDRELESSVLEFTARFHEEQREFAVAIGLLTRAAELDRAMADSGRRALGLHTRMLANVLVKTGDKAGALELLIEAEANTSDWRNLSRVMTVRAKALTPRYPAEAEQALQRAWQLAQEAGATQYSTELNEAFGESAFARGDFATAGQCWQRAWQTFFLAGHPREAEFRAKLNSVGWR